MPKGTSLQTEVLSVFWLFFMSVLALRMDDSLLSSPESLSHYGSCKVQTCCSKSTCLCLSHVFPKSTVQANI